MPYQQILQKYAYWGNFACRIHIIQIPTIFMKNAKE